LYKHSLKIAVTCYAIGIALIIFKAYEGVSFTAMMVGGGFVFASVKKI
jgi:hypothetical protein